MHRWIGCVILALALMPAPWAALEEGVESGLFFRVRVLKMTPEEPALIHWRYGGEGLTSGDVIRGVVTQEKPEAPAGPAAEKNDDLGLGGLTLEDDAPTDRIIVQGDTYDLHYLRPRVWSRRQPINHLGSTSGRRFLTFMITGHESGNAIKDAELEFEVFQGKELLKRFTIAGPDGPTFGLVIPFHRLDNGKPTEAFVAELGSLRLYAEQKLASLNAEPWINQPTPTLYGILTDCFGYSPGQGYKIRTSDQETMLAEFEVLRLMGFNGLRGAPSFIFAQMREGQGLGAEFRRVHEAHCHAAMIPTIGIADGRPPTRRPGDGCPWDPANRRDLDERAIVAAEAYLERAAALGVDQSWGLTWDEIGSLFGRAPEGMAHMGSCPHCCKAFREMIQKDGRTLEEFGATSWDPIRPTYGYWSINFWESQRILQAAVDDAQQRMEEAAKAGSPSVSSITGNAANPVLDELTADITGEKPKGDPAADLLTARARMEELIWRSRILQVPEEDRVLEVSEEGWALLHYYSRRFNAESTASVFYPTREAYEAINARKRAAISRGETTSSAARQPWVYSFALRGNNFLMGGHSLGFFDFYRLADNAMVYETSNRDARIWHWDSYLCDVGRSLTRFQDREFGIYIKPHRGAPIQRALASVARGVRMIFWYTYGPDWAKGDTFGGREDNRRDIARVNRLIAGAEQVTFDGDWAIPAEVAIVRPRTAEFLGDSASWENGKWVYSALQHAHIPVDPLDEELLEELDLSVYKVIVISGSHIRRSSAEKLRQWVYAGGTLYTSGWGMARDEADRPLTKLYPLFGVSERRDAESWGNVPRYGATALRAVTPSGEPPATAAVTGAGLLTGTFTPVVGREVLSPLPEAEVMATYADGSAAAIRHRYGKGTAWLIGTWAGVEYAWETMQRQPFDADKRNWIAAPLRDAGIEPVVDADEPLVEGHLMVHPETGKRAVILINWAFRLDREVEVRLRASTSGARSLALQVELPVRHDGDSTILTLDRLDEGDILLLND